MKFGASESIRNVITLLLISHYSELIRLASYAEYLARGGVPGTRCRGPLSELIAKFVSTLLNPSLLGRGLGDVPEFRGTGGRWLPPTRLEEKPSGLVTPVLPVDPAALSTFNVINVLDPIELLDPSSCRPPNEPRFGATNCKTAA